MATFTHGYPKMGGFRLSIEPVSGWALSAQRIARLGRRRRGRPVHSPIILRAFFDPGQAQTAGFGARLAPIGKQEASLTSRFIFPGRVPFSVYFEYAGNDTLAGHSPLIGKPDISAGIDFPRIGPFSLTYEITSFAPTWYVHPATPPRRAISMASPTTATASATGSAISVCWRHPTPSPTV